jgi:hypothetical protein
MKLELRKLSDIKPCPGNPRQNDAAADAVATSIREFGFRRPIVVGSPDAIAWPTLPTCAPCRVLLPALAKGPKVASGPTRADVASPFTTLAPGR